MTLGLAKPAGVKFLIKSMPDAVAFLNAEGNKSLKIMVLINVVNDALFLVTGVPEIHAVNFGGIRSKEGAKQISKAIALTDDDIAGARELLRRGIELEIRQVPTDEKQKVSTLIEV